MLQQRDSQPEPRKEWNNVMINHFSGGQEVHRTVARLRDLGLDNAEKKERLSLEHICMHTTRHVRPREPPCEGIEACNETGGRR